MSGDTVNEIPSEPLVRACRTAIGDELRSIVYFTEDTFKQVYLRDDLTAEADIRTFVENERVGFKRQSTDVESELGSYEFTIHGFESGYLIRVLSDDRGVFVTTDALSITHFEEVVTAVTDVLRDY